MNAFLTAWRWSGRLPIAVTRATASAVAWTAWATRHKTSERLEANLARVTGLQGRELRKLSRQGMASVARYYSEVLEAGRLTGDVIDARVRYDNYDEVRGVMEGTETGVVGVLSHSGNWDLVGAHAARHVIPITAVAEILKPQEVFDQFVELREKIGISVLGHEGSSTFRKLITITRKEHTLVCLLSDRDISGTGVEVHMWGHRVKVAPGPAALSVATKAPLVPVMIRYERLRGAQRRAAKSRWGIVYSFGPVMRAEDFDAEDKVAQMSQAWAAWFADQIAAHPQDWHMLQRFGWVE